MKNPDERINLNDALQEPWILSNNKSINIQISEQLNRNINVEKFNN